MLKFGPPSAMGIPCRGIASWPNCSTSTCWATPPTLDRYWPEIAPEFEEDDQWAPLRICTPFVFLQYFCTVLKKVLYVAQAGLRTGGNPCLRFRVGISGMPHSAQLNPLVSEPFIHYPSGDSLASPVLSTIPSSPSLTPTQVPETSLPSSGSPLKFLVKESVMKYDSSQVNLALRRI